MDVTGKVIRILPLVTGEGKNGTWKKQEFVIETAAQFPKKICFSIWGDKVDQFNIKENEQLNVSFDLESREYNGRWFTEARVWKIAKENQPVDQEPPQEAYSDFPPATDVKDDLPF